MAEKLQKILGTSDYMPREITNYQNTSSLHCGPKYKFKKKENENMCNIKLY